MTSFGNIPYWDGILPKRSNRWLGHLMHTIELSSEVAQSLLVSHLEVKVHSKNKQKGILS